MGKPGRSALGTAHSRADSILQGVGEAPAPKKRPPALVALVQSMPPGTEVSMGFLDHSGDHRTVQVTLGTDRGPP
jgi:S1-C subfamily serine protease